MTETGEGFYKYVYSGYAPSKIYTSRCDGGADLADEERYTYGANDSVSINEMEEEIDDFDGGLG